MDATFCSLLAASRPLTIEFVCLQLEVCLLTIEFVCLQLGLENCLITITVGDKIITYYILNKKLKSCKETKLHYSNYSHTAQREKL